MHPSDTLATVQHSEPPAQGGLFSLEPGIMIWTWVVFGLVLLVLRKYAWTPMMQNITDRERIMSDAVENARKTREELEQVALQQKQLLETAAQQAREIISQGRSQAEEATRAITERAQREAADALEQGRLQLRREQQEALHQLKSQVADLVIDTSRKVLGAGLSEQDQQRILSQQLDDL
jgi:F-type H+-transporting ATPase subunit b